MYSIPLLTFVSHRGDSFRMTIRIAVGIVKPTTDEPDGPEL
jgi:hypothetical protein